MGDFVLDIIKEVNIFSQETQNNIYQQISSDTKFMFNTSFVHSELKIREVTRYFK